MFFLADSQSKLFSILCVSNSLFRVTLHRLTPLFADFSYSSTACQGIKKIKPNCLTFLTVEKRLGKKKNKHHNNNLSKHFPWAKAA